MPYKQLSATVDGKPLGEFTCATAATGDTLIAVARLFAMTETDLRVEVFERHHDHPLPPLSLCLICPPGKLIRVWNGPRPTIMRSAAHAALLELDPAFRKLDMTASMDRITAVLDHFYSDGAVDLYAFIKAQVQSMMDAETFKRTAPGWNCVDYPGAGMHYVPVAGGDCVWCGASPDEMSQS